MFIEKTATPCAKTHRCDSQLKAGLLQLCWRPASEAVEVDFIVFTVQMMCFDVFVGRNQAVLDWKLSELLAQQKSCSLRLDLRHSANGWKQFIGIRKS